MLEGFSCVIYRGTHTSISPTEVWLRKWMIVWPLGPLAPLAPFPTLMANRVITDIGRLV